MSRGCSILMPGLLWLMALGVWPSVAQAHASTLNVLSLRELSSGEFVASWERTQGLDDPSAAYDLMQPQFPEQCLFEVPQLHCGERGLTGSIGFNGLAQLSTSGMIKITWADGNTRALSLTPVRPHALLNEVRPGASPIRRAADFVYTGLLHIWLGVDHLLFVFGLLWLVDSWRVLVRTITAFTIAHSVTLAAATSGLCVFAPAPVEAVIALSIAFVAVEIAGETRTGTPSFTRQNPWLVAFAFGLLHGFGFANALAEIEIPEATLPLALLGFNVGVELGQLGFVALLLAGRLLLRRLPPPAASGLRTVGYYALGTLAMYWFFERVFAFVPSPLSAG